jgi:uncharacterized protein YjeT (DUF2065 family)
MVKKELKSKNMWLDFLRAIALVLVIEGVLPFLKPEIWRRTMGKIADRPNNTVRLVGLMSMLVGVALLSMVRQG